MTRTDLPASVFPDVLIANGVTYVALPLISGGLEIWRSDIGGAVILPPGSWPRLFAHATGILCAYKTGDDNALTVANITTGILTRTGIPAFWNSPICWREDGFLCTQATAGNDVWGAVWPAVPAPPVVRVGAGTGLAQWNAPGTVLATWDELGVTVQPVYLPGASVSQAQQGGVQVTLGSASGVIEPGTYSNNPRPALAADGSLTFVYWTQDSHGATGTVLYQGVTPADLGTLSTIPPFTTPKILASYDSGRAKGDNGVVMRDAQVLARYADGKLIRYFDTEQDEPVTAHPCVAYADLGYIGAATSQLIPGDAVAFNVYPTAGESLDGLKARALRAIAEAQQKPLSVLLVGCAWNRLGTLSDQTVLDGMDLVRELADVPGVIGIEWFGLNRGTLLGYFKPLYQQAVDRFVSPGWPAWPSEVPMASVTITSYAPVSGPAPLQVRAVASFEGNVAQYMWRFRLLGGPSWMVAAVNPVSDVDHTYSFPSAGTYEISLAGLDPSGNLVAETGMQRLVAVSVPPNDDQEQALAQLEAAHATMRTAIDHMHAVLGK